jgi:hypothetical protein
METSMNIKDDDPYEKMRSENLGTIKDIGEVVVKVIRREIDSKVEGACDRCAYALSTIICMELSEFFMTQVIQANEAKCPNKRGKLKPTASFV